MHMRSRQKSVLYACVCLAALAAAAPALAADAAASGTIETVVVTGAKVHGDIQNIPVAVTALSQKDLTAQQISGGPDLIKSVPNLTFSKTNFTGYNIQIRGIGTQAISVSTDPAVAVALNDTPFIRNHFFEQEFFDLDQAQVLRGPQGTLFGRNATAGVVNLITAKPTDEYAGFASVDVGNYNGRRLEGMVNIPIIGDKLDLRVAGEWTTRDGYTFDNVTNNHIDGRNLWSGRATLQFKPVDNLVATVVWEHFSEDDNRQRSGKQLCERDPGPDVVDGPAGPQIPDSNENGNFGKPWLSQGCLPGSLYAPTAFETPNAGANPFIAAGYAFGITNAGADPYGGVSQSPDLRTISSALAPHYKARNDTVELNVDFAITPELTLSSLSGYNKDSLYSTEDANGFGSAPGVFQDNAAFGNGTLVGQDLQYCDPQLGCSDRFIGMDVSDERAEQFSQEFRLSSNFSGPFNFTVGANYLHYRTLEDYYVFYNALTIFTQDINYALSGQSFPADAGHIAFDPAAANACGPQPASQSQLDTSFLGLGCAYIDPHPLSQIDGNGHNYFRSQNPYLLNSWAGFGEANYQVTPDVKLTAGLRWTDDQKRFDVIPSWAGILGEGYLTTGTVRQEWSELTGRFNAQWTPKFDFTDQSMFYASYSRGYKGGGANPPGVIPVSSGGTLVTSPSNQTHPATFKPEFIDAFELGGKNTLLDNALTIDADVFYYAYQNYQISEIVDRTSVNLNFNTHVRGAEIEATWQPTDGLAFNLSGGWENATIDGGQSAIDLMDRTAGNPDWMVVKPYITQTSNCVLPRAVVNELLAEGGIAFGCVDAYTFNEDPVTQLPYVPNPGSNFFGPLPGYAGFDPATAPNGGQGFAKNLTGNKLPNAPPFTLSMGAQYSMPVSGDWLGTFRTDFYWQGNSFARVFNDRPYDQLHGYTNVNLALSFNNSDGWQAMFYAKNLFDTTAITGSFLNSDDLMLTTNVFLTDPRLFGVRISKSF